MCPAQWAGAAALSLGCQGDQLLCGVLGCRLLCVGKVRGYFTAYSTRASQQGSGLHLCWQTKPQQQQALART
eukprot:CAMPEP_0202861556 /NCGR_PEP_ID=MMETSP1391-20130828/2915_1 /ASSEMBLY_ACC=CAM_ASM_000867 /TAXON_ID=1034604 /ORGANISM="Chlamydomonas leiostraca, Strain SAG 11-49" /LENGTH=71 /DNA_ID=CAMNT_0049540965 /DNA_START=76 /DNA_END=291 /DNA_ORIENTATION=-